MAEIKTTDELRAAQVKSLRERLNLSVAQLAERAGVSPRTVEGWEQGRGGKRAIERALKILGMT
jgi:DNA-binding transcriptional regulator YiaG